jgi:hypothetical protein
VIRKKEIHMIEAEMVLPAASEASATLWTLSSAADLRVDQDQECDKVKMR